jgi:hypothetical protein
MTTQGKMAINLYRLLEEYDNPRRIMNLIPLIDDLNRWNINIRDYENYDIDIGAFVIDVNNPIRTYTVGNRPLPINYGDSMLTFFIWLIKWELGNDMYPMADEIVKMLILNGAKSSPYIYNSWLVMEDEYDDEGEETYDIYNNIKKYLGLFYTINKLKNVRNKNKKARTIQKRFRGNKSRLHYSDNPTKYMRNVPGLKKSVWDAIDEDLDEGGISTPYKENFKVEEFDPLWMSDREIEANNLMAEYVNSIKGRTGTPDKNSVTLHPEVGKCYEYQVPGMRENDEWKYAGRFVKRVKWMGPNDFHLHDHFDNQNFMKDDGSLTGLYGVEGANNKVWQKTDILYRGNSHVIKEKDTLYREVKCRDEYNLLKNKKKLALSKLLLMPSDYSKNTGFEPGITDNILENLENLYKDKWNKYGVSQDNIHKRMERETEDERRGYNLDGYDVKGYDKDGYERDGYDANGYDKDGYDVDGYDANGYDINGYDINGYDIDGYDVNGFDENGLHVINFGGNNKKKTYRKRY